VNLVVKPPAQILLINPWLCDFAAHDLWSKPLGLLLLGGFLRHHGYQLRLLDCLDVHDPLMQGMVGVKPATRRSFGTGKFHRTERPKPNILRDVDRTYYRFGITPEVFRARLLQGAKPDVVMVTSAMTYWYPGVQETIRLIKECFPRVPVVLGGIYATLCWEHASRHSGADHVLAGPGENQILQFLEKLAGHRSHEAAQSEVELSRPVFDLLDRLDSVCVLTSRGCPGRCPYCGSHLLHPGFSRRKPVEVADELEYWHDHHGVEDVAFYDDALLLDARSHMLPLLAELQRRKLRFRFHTPNGVHVNALSAEVCEALYLSGFKTLRLGLETSDLGRQQQLGAKVAPGAFSRAMDNLTGAGFSPEQIGVYLLCGLPAQDPGEVADSIRLVQDHGARPYLAEYSPIPGTRLWPEALNGSPFPLATEPLYHNNSLLPCRSTRFGLEELQWLKQLCRHGR
jgi:radical SAM superfamily enzyme YgiQ (UPF0313 family)